MVEDRLRVSGFTGPVANKSTLMAGSNDTQCDFNQKELKKVSVHFRLHIGRASTTESNRAARNARNITLMTTVGRPSHRLRHLRLSKHRLQRARWPVLGSIWLESYLGRLWIVAQSSAPTMPFSRFSIASSEVLVLVPVREVW